MSEQVAQLWSDAIVASGTVVRYGHWGRPVLVFPAEQGRARDFEHNGMIGAIVGLLGAGRLKVYCVDSYDAASWSNREIPLEDRARRHGGYESWILGSVLPWIYADCGGAAEVVTLGCSLGAFHAANFALKPDRWRAPSGWPPCSRVRASGMSSTCGVTTCPTTGRPGAPSLRITCRDSADEGSPYAN